MPKTNEVVKLDELAREAGNLIHRLSLSADNNENTANILRMTMEMLSFLEASGHVCMNLRSWTEKNLPWNAQISFPTIPEWEKVLSNSSLVGEGNAVTPFVLAENKIYLYRLWKAEKELAASIHSRLSDDITTDLSTYKDEFKRCFPESNDEIDWPAVATFTSLRYTFSIITGGPGTGKTTTVAKIISILRASTPEIDITLAAPTGKAATRLDESLAQANIENIAGAKTIHRLLSTDRNGNFRHNKHNPLTTDVLIVDESSMIDLELFNSLFKALAPHTRLILLGDSGQLSSVNAGMVLGDLCKAIDEDTWVGKSQAFADAFENFHGAKVPISNNKRLVDCITKLRITHRSQECPNLNNFAAMIRKSISDKDIEEAISAMTAATNPDDLRLLTPQEDEPNINIFIEPVKDEIDAIFSAATPEEALLALAKFRVLTPLRQGEWGVSAINELIEFWLKKRKMIDGNEFYHGRPILITRNDYQQDLFNGDLGIVWSKSGEHGVCFASAPDKILPFGKLPPHETSWAMTVHKSQGSEFDKLVMLIPNENTPVLTKELLYTGLTRASRQATLYCETDAIRKALENPANRESGLLDNFPL